MPELDLNIALLPHDIVEGNTQANLDRVAARISGIRPDTHLVVLPEMFNTGFTPDPDLLHIYAEPNDGPTVTTAEQWSRRYGFAVWGGFTACEGDRFFNRGFMTSADGSPTLFYDKHHLFRGGGEHRVLTPGTSQAPVVTLRTWKLRMALCYDIRFPVWCRNVGLAYDALIVPANWAHSRVFAWKHMLIARAVENQAYVAGCNREGSDRYGVYPPGDSFIFNHWGDDVASPDGDGTIYATFSARALTADRERFSPWRDADPFTLR